MDILHLLDRLETVLTSGSRLPMTGKTLVDEHECLDIVDQLRVAIPEEVKQARRIHSERDRLLQESEDQAERTVAHAQEQASMMVQQHEVARAAEAKALRLVEDAEAEATERREEADRYAAQTLADLENRLAEVLTVVRNGIRSLDRNGHASDSMKP